MRGNTIPFSSKSHLPPNQWRRYLEVITSAMKGIKESNEIRRAWSGRSSLDDVVLRGALRWSYICTQSWGKSASTVRVWGKKASFRGSTGAKALRQKWAWQISEREKCLESNSQVGEGKEAELRSFRSQNLNSLCHIVRGRGTWHSVESLDDLK